MSVGSEVPNELLKKVNFREIVLNGFLISMVLNS